MKTKIALSVVAVAFAIGIATPSRAEAGDLDKAKQMANRMLVHVVHMAVVLDANLNTPDKAVNEINAYFAHKKRVAEFKALAAQARGMKLNEADKQALKTWMMGRKELKRVESSFKAFATKNPQSLQKLIGVFMKLQGLMPK